MSFTCSDCRQAFPSSKGLGQHRSRYCKARKQNRDDDLKEMLELKEQIQAQSQEQRVENQIVEEGQGYSVCF